MAARRLGPLPKEKGKRPGPWLWQGWPVLLPLARAAAVSTGLRVHVGRERTLGVQPSIGLGRGSELGGLRPGTGGGGLGFAPARRARAKPTAAVAATCRSAA